MMFDELAEQMSELELSAIEYLESIGYQIFTEARMDDCKKKDGKRVRTFAAHGRYDILIGLESVSGRAKSKVKKPASKKDLVGDNFWMNRDRWHKMNRQGFHALVVEEAIEDLKAAPQDVQEEVKIKFLRFFDASEWPLK